MSQELSDVLLAIKNHKLSESIQILDNIIKENNKNYAAGPHISAAFWVKVPDNSGDFVFQYNPNKYMVSETTIKSVEGFFLMFDSTVKHRVTENLSDDYRIVVSMNFNLVDM